MSSGPSFDQTQPPLGVLHAAPLQWGKITGIDACVPALIAAQNRRGDIRAGLVLTSDASTSAPPGLAFPVFGRQALLRNGPWDLPPPLDKPDLVVFHSTYIPVHAALAKQLRTRGIPYMICPHGGMTQRAQAYRGWKKRLGNLLFFNRLVAHAAAIQCLSPGEAAASDHWNRPIVVVGNGVDPPAESDMARPGTSSPLRLVFLGRLAIEHKGLDLLVEACAATRAALRSRNARVELYGPDQGGSRKLLADRLRRLGLDDLVGLHEPVHGPAKTELLRQSDVFVHTSRWEGHSIAILEALAAGLPCLLTPGTNMAEEVAAVGAGWQVEPSASGIAAGLLQILQSDPKTLQEAGAQARRLILRQYTWDKVASRTVEAYRKFATR